MAVNGVAEAQYGRKGAYHEWGSVVAVTQQDR